MKKVMKKFNRALSIMLVAAMVLTMAPQTAMPVLAAQDEIVESENGTDVGETVEAPETVETEEVAAPSDEGNTNTEGDDILNGDPADEEAVEEEPSEEEVMDPSTEDEETISNSTMEVELFDEVEAPKKPEITVTRGSDEVDVADGTAKIERRKDAKTKFALKNTAEDKVEYLYTDDGTDPKKSENKLGTGAEITDNMDLTKDGYTFKVVAAKTVDGSETPVYSEVTEIKVEYKKAVFLDADSDTKATLKVGGTSLSKESGYVDTSGQKLELEVTVTDDTKEIEKVEYKTVSAAKWTAATLNNNKKYEIPAAQIKNNNVLVKASVISKRKITVNLADGTTYNMFKVSVKEGTKAAEDKVITTDTNSGNVIYVAATGTVKVTIQAAEGYTLKSAKFGETVKNATNNKVESNITADTTIEVTATKAYNKAVIKETDKDGKAQISEDGKKTYNVEARKAYYISATQGNDPSDLFSIGEAKCVPAVDGVTLTDNKNAEENPDGTWTMSFDPSKANGRTVTVKLYEKKGDTKEVDTLIFKVAPIVSSVTVGGTVTVNGGKAIKQEISTSKSYPLTVTNAASTDVLKAVADDNEAYISKVDVNKDEKTNKWTLSVTTKTVEESTNKAATIQILNMSDNAQSGTKVGTVDVYVTNPAWAKTAPTVKQTDSTDIELYLDLTRPTNAGDPTEGKYFYEVKAAASGTADGLAENLTQYYPAAEDNKTTKATMQVLAAAFGDGKKVDFNVTATLILAVEDVTASQADEPTAVKTFKVGEKTYKAIVTGRTSNPAKCATKDVYHSEKLTLKKEKAASSLYTGQEAVVATVVFDKLATYTRDEDVKATVENNTDNADDDYKISVVKSDKGYTVNGGKVTLKVGKYVEPGKYKIRVDQVEKAKAIDADTITASATMEVNVVQGIYQLDADDATIYVKNVASKKDGKAKIVPVYNGNVAKPKTAKVTYKLGQKENGTFAEQNVDFVTLKPNGEVIVDKSYEPAIEGETTVTNNTFYVQICAADFDDNKTKTTKEVKCTIVTEPQTLGKIVLLQKSNTETSTQADTTSYKIVGIGNTKDTNTIKADEAKDTSVRILQNTEANAAKKVNDTVTEDDLVPVGRYVLTLSNKKDIAVNSTNTLTVNKVVKNITVTAKTNDGGNNSVAKTDQLVFSVGYEDITPANAKLSVKMGNAELITDNATTATITGPTGTILHLEALDSKGESLNNGRVVDVKIDIAKADATIVKNSNNLVLDIVMKKPEIKVTLTKASVKNSDSKKEYTLKNDNIALTTVAPKVTLAKAPKLYAQYGTDQELTFNVAKWDDTKNGKANDVEKIIISAAADDDSQSLYKQIVANGSEIAYEPDTAKGNTFKVKFNTTGKAPIKKATLYFDFVGTDGAIINKTAAGVTVKSELFKKSFKLTDKYTMSVKDKAKVDLDGKKVGMETDTARVTYKRILNANIKGKPNKFINMFTLNNKALILTDETLADNKNNLIGYVEYTVTYDDGTTQNFTTKLTITIKPNARTLKATASNVLLDTDVANMTPVITVMEGKAPVNVAWASYDNDTFVVDTSDEAREGWKKGEIALKVKAGKTPAAGTLSADLQVIPAENKYGAEAWGAYQQSQPKNDDKTDEQADSVTWADIAPTATTIKNVKVVTKPANTTGKITVANNLKTVTITETYKAEVPYTLKLVAKVSEVTVATKTDNKDNVTPLAPGWIEFKKAEGKDAIVISINKDKYVKAVLAEGKDRNGKYKLNGKQQTNVTAQVSFAATGAKPENVVFKITPPQLSADDLIDSDIDSVKITLPATGTKIAPGGTLNFEAEVAGISGVTLTDDQKKVTWSITTDGVKEGTAITEEGKLTIAEEEDKSSITVKATSVANNTKYATIEIAIGT